ncbi:hypothetical protein PV703_12605 [Streptomyces sp. ME01-24h]|nr:hypothetical protein [Streptomyces sp. ME19-03-3]MDX3354129.1 hypothetical protein [Streptomyces sp. ME01-24h]
MSAYGRKEDEVRRLLGGPYPAVPVDLAPRAAERGRRILARRRVRHAVLWTLLVVGVVVALVLAALWSSTAQPLETTPDTW